MQALMMDYQLTIDRILEYANRLYPQKRIVTKLPDGSFHQYTYHDLYNRTKQLANALGTLGVEMGDRVGTFAWNNYQHLELYYGIPGAGAICHTLNIRLPPEQLAYIVNHAEDKVVFIDATLLPLYERIADEVRCVQHHVLLNADVNTETSLPNVVFYEDLLADASTAYDWRSTDEQMAMGLCYTSGTTGNPKGALYGHRSMYMHTMGSCHANSLAVSETDIVLPVVPQFHAMAWGLPYACLMAGAEVIMPGPHLQPAALAEMIEAERVTVAAGVPTIWTGLYQELKSNPRDISSVRAMVVGGAAMPRALIEAFEKELNVNVLHAWGMTEMSPLGTVSRLQGHHTQVSEETQLDIKAKQGYPVAGVELRIMNDAGEELPWDGDTMGEVQVRGPWIVNSYFKVEPSEEQFTADGWFRTGDVATMSLDGYMNITDRTKDLIKSGGEWISSVALENALMAHPQILEAAVIAIPDAKWSERPLAAIVLTPETAPDSIELEAVREFLSPNFAKFQLPEQFVILDEIPKTSVGKFDKKVLRRQHAEGTLA